jgi:regulator of sigma E protease
MSWLLAVGALVALIIIHELGHFLAAKAVGMRVERFSLFFGPVLLSVRRGETEYALSALPLGGYVRITGQNPREELPEDLKPRSFFAKPPWQRLIVILAGPFANVLVAIVLAWLAFFAFGQARLTETVSGPLQKPASEVLRPGDRVVSVDGRRGDVEVLARAIGSHPCRGVAKAGCRSATPAIVVIERDGVRRTIAVRPAYDGKARRMRLGFAFTVARDPVGPLHAFALGEGELWRATKLNLSVFSHIFQERERKRLNGVVGTVDVTQQLIRRDGQSALFMIALISLALAIVNMLPILPLDGGHCVWALLDWVRRRPMPVAVMERTAFVGILLVIVLAVVALSNDVSALQNGGLNVR